MEQNNNGIDIKRISDKISDLESELEILLRQIKALKQELDINNNNNKKILVFNNVIDVCLQKSKQFDYTTQAEIFAHLKKSLKKDKILYKNCQEFGWKENSVSNVFWRDFWKYLSIQSGINRVVCSKNDIRFYGLLLKNIKNNDDIISLC